MLLVSLRIYISHNHFVIIFVLCFRVALLQINRTITVDVEESSCCYLFEIRRWNDLFLWI